MWGRGLQGLVKTKSKPKNERNYPYLTRRVEIVIDLESTCLSTLSSAWKSQTLFECPVCWFTACHKGFLVGSSFYSQTFIPNVTQFAFTLESCHSSNLMLRMFLVAGTCLVNSVNTQPCIAYVFFFRRAARGVKVKLDKKKTGPSKVC